MNLLHAGIRRILLPTDFSHESVAALPHAIAFARIFDADLALMHVVPTVTGALEKAMLPYQLLPDLEADALREAESDLRAFARPAQDAGLRPTRVVRSGVASQEILAEAVAMAADLIIIGTRGLGGIERFVLGSVADQLLRHSLCPVLTVCHEEGRTWSAPGLIESILCAVDFTPTAHAAIDLALRLAGAKNARVTVLHVAEQDQPDVSQPQAGVPEREPVEVASESPANAWLRFVVPADSSIRVQTRVTAGVAHEEILRVALDEQADVIIMGTRARGPVGRAIFGATCDHVVRGATCPVLTIPPPPGHVERDSRPSTVALASRT